MQDQLPVLLTIYDLSRILKLSRFTLTRHIAAGKIPNPDIKRKVHLWLAEGPIKAVLEARAQHFEALARAAREAVSHE